MELAAFALLVLHLRVNGPPAPQSRTSRALLALFALLVLLVLLQLLPLPEGLLGLLSPGALATWRQFGGGAPGSRHPVSLYPDATRRELFKVLAYAAVFVVVAGHFRTRDRIRLLVKTILFTGGLVATLAVAQRLTWNGRILWFYPVEESLRSGAGIWGPFVNRNHFAGYLGLVLPLGLGMALHAAPDAPPLRGVPWTRRLGRALASERIGAFAGWFLLVLLLAACVISTRSRGAVAGSAAAGLLFAWLTVRKRSLRSRLLPPALAGAAVLAVVVLPAWDRLSERFDDPDQDRTVHRLQLFADTVGMLKDYPLLGTGLGTFEQGYRRYQTRYPRLLFDHAHNDYLELATDTGAVGFLLGGAIAALVGRALLRGWRRHHGTFTTSVGAGGLASCFGLAVHSGVDFNLRIPANALLFTVIAALTHAALSRAPDPEAPAGPDVPGRRTPARLLFAPAAAALALLLFFPAREFAADYSFRRVARVLDDAATEELDAKPLGDDSVPSYRQALGSLLRSSALEPSHAAYALAQAQLYAALGTWAQTMEALGAPLPAGAPAAREARGLAIAAAQRAAALEPTNPEPHLALGQLFAADGDPGRADPQIRLALAAHPVNAPLRYTVAAHYLQAGRAADALEQAGVLARIDDSYLLPDTPRNALQAARRTDAYLSLLKGSYLFRALEIGWRATGDLERVKALAPPTEAARAVVELFLEWRGLESAAAAPARAA
jgi:O-antigen ligase